MNGSVSSHTDEALFLSVESIRGIVLYLRIVGPVKWLSWPKLSEIICCLFYDVYCVRQLVLVRKF